MVQINHSFGANGLTNLGSAKKVQENKSEVAKPETIIQNFDINLPTSNSNNNDYNSGYLFGINGGGMMVSQILQETTDAIKDKFPGIPDDVCKIVIDNLKNFGSKLHREDLPKILDQMRDLFIVNDNYVPNNWDEATYHMTQAAHTYVNNGNTNGNNETELSQILNNFLNEFINNNDTNNFLNKVELADKFKSLLDINIRKSYEIFNK